MGVSDRTEKTFPMDESISSDMDSLSPKPVEQKETKKGKKKKEKKSKAEGKTKDKKEKKGKKGKSVKFSEEKPEKDAADKKTKKKSKKGKSEKNLVEKEGKKKKEKKAKSEKKLGEKKSKKEKKPKSMKKPKSEILEGGKKSKKDKKAKSSNEDFGQLVSKSFKIGSAETEQPRSETTFLLTDSFSHLSNHSTNLSSGSNHSFIDSLLEAQSSKKKLDKLSKAEKKIMKPKPGERFVEFEKCYEDPSSGLELEVKGNFVFVKSVQSPAPAHNLHPRDRVIALNGKKIEAYNKDMNLIRATLESGNPIRLVINPTALR